MEKYKVIIESVVNLNHINYMLDGLNKELEQLNPTEFRAYLTEKQIKSLENESFIKEIKRIFR